MAPRKKADDQADEAVEVQVEAADEVQAEDAPAAEPELTQTKDAAGRVVAEAPEGEKFSTLDHDEDDPSVELPTPGGPGEEGAPTRTEKAFVLASVTHPEVTSQNPEPYSVDELNHRFTHIPPEGFVERKFPVKQ